MSSSSSAEEGGGGGRRIDGASRRLMRLGNIGPPQRRPVSLEEVKALQQEVASLKESREEDQETIADLRTDVDALSHEVEILGRQLAALVERERQRVRRDQDAPGPVAAAERGRRPADIDAKVSDITALPPPLEKVPTVTRTEQQQQQPPKVAAAEFSSSLPRLPKSIV